ncbi:DUF1365 domain-containing protein [Nocardioides speluncae]|uniref:DUF1365 domain-containing protein n=1 Tax=Nocardioides speluncae TaxID=2670337 RepID=UPI00197D2943|nr:DUF1365 domain-containing protein [Nocardioides speluncae]
MSAAFAGLPWCYDVEIGHRRRDPLPYAFRNRIRTWLVDLDDLPRLPAPWHRLARFDARDHPGGLPSIRANVDRLLAEHGVRRPDRVLMLAQPRVYGHVFNPLTVFYCLAADGSPEYAVAEVRNTYGGRHCYVMRFDALETEKAFYVSPFHPVDGSYTMRLPLPGDRLAVSVTLHRAGQRPFVATMTGTRRPGTSLAATLRRPLENRAVMAGIRRHGIALYLRGLRPYSRSAVPDSEGSTDDHHRVTTYPHD